MIKTNIKNTKIVGNLDKYKAELKLIHNEMIHGKKGLGSDFLGWVEWPNNYDKTEWDKMKAVANKLLQLKIDVLVVIGIGGSYLGSRAGIEMINGLYSKSQVEIIYVGHTMSSTYTKQVLEYLENKHFAINVISKSGTTTEPAIAFRIFKQLLERKLKNKKEISQLIVVTTDKEKGVLKELAIKEGYETFVIPDNIGGRFSVLTAVGIFPMLIAGVNIDDIMFGAKEAYNDLNCEYNDAYLYGLSRYILNKDYNYKAEMLANYEIQMQTFNEWWKQLFGESEGKNEQGLLPVSVVFSTDLHSMGQYIQEGTKILFETVLKFNKVDLENDIHINNDNQNLDKLNYLSHLTLNEINYIACDAVVDAHFKVGKVDNIILELSQPMNAKMFGYLVYFFFKACAMSAYLLKLNPFNQPGVEVYKKNMFELLKK